MPIGIDRFEADDLDGPTTSERILRFLLAHDDQAFTRSEIADAIDVSPETVGTNLTRLKKRSLVRHCEPYWAITDDRKRALEAVGGDEQKADGESEADPATRSRDRQHREAAKAFFERARNRLADTVEDLYLFGSVARDSETASSDIDVLAVIADDADVATADDHLLDIAYDIQLEFGVPVEVHTIQASEFAARRDRGEPFVRTVVEEGRLDV